MATIVTDLHCDLTQNVKPQFLHGNLFSQDNAANTINVHVFNGGEPAAMGGSISANVIRSDGATVAVSGAIEGNKAYIILPQACYAVPGVIKIIIKNTESTTVTTIAAVVANVYASSTDTVVDPGQIIPSVAALIAQIEAAVDSIPVDYSGLLATIAADYSSSKTYPIVGMYAWQGGVLKRNIVPITTAETYTAAHWTNAVLGDDVTALKSAIEGNIAKDYIVLNGQEVKPSTLVWEQGNFTSTNDDVASTKDIRTTTWFSGGVFIYNPSRLFQFSVMQNNGSGTKNYYDAFSSPVTGVDHYFDDAVAFIPKRKIGTYRIKVTKRVGGTGSKLEFTPSDAQIYLYEQTNQELAFMIGSVASGGYSYDLSSLVTDELQIGEHSGIRFRLVDDDYQMAVYSTSNSTSFKLTQGWWQKQGECDSWDKSKKYVCRVGAKSGVTFTYADAVKAVQIEYIDKRYCYERNYTDITYTLQWSAGNVTSGGVDSDSHYIHAELPCVGNVEVKLNWPSCKFTVWKKDENDNFANLIDDSALNPDVWTYYFCRYNSDDKDGTVYYVVVTSINETTTFSKFSYGKRGIKVYTYEDMGVLADSPSPWYGKRVAVMGDSIVQGRFRKGNADSTNSVCSKPWAVLVAERSNTEPADFGIGGACVYGENWLSLYTNRNKISGYDIVLVCAGTNDYKASGVYTTEVNFKTAYGAVLDALVANNTKVYAVTPTRREESINATNDGGLTLHDYAEFVKSVAADKNVTVIDLYAMSVGNDEFVASLADGIHPIEYGQKIIADLILQNVPVES